MRRSLVLVGVLVPLVLLPAACSRGGDDAGGGGGGGGGDAVVGVAEESPERGGALAVEPAQGEGESSGGADAAAQGDSTPAELPGAGPRVIQTASLRISVKRDGFESAVEEARTVVAGLGGYVTSSSARQGPGKRLVRGTLVARVPGRSYARAMAALAEIGRVEGREESGADVSQEFVDLEARARHLEAVEGQLLELLERADTVAAALAVQSKLNETQLRLEEVRGRLRYLEDQTSLATIALTIRERLPVAPAGNRDWGIREAWSDAVRGFVYVTGRIVVAAAWAAPVALLVVFALVVARLAGRRPLGRFGV